MDTLRTPLFTLSRKLNVAFGLGMHASSAHVAVWTPLVNIRQTLPLGDVRNSARSRAH